MRFSKVVRRRHIAANHDPRVLLVDEALRDNGAIRTLCQMAVCWRNAGVTVRLFAIQRLPSEQITPLPPGLAPIFATPGPARMRSSLPRALPRLIREARACDVVGSISEVGTGLLLGYLAARLTRRPFVAWIQTRPEGSIDQWMAPPLRPLARYVHRHLDLAFCVEPTIVDEMHGEGLPADRAVVLPTALDFEAVSRSARNHDGLQDPPLVVTAARLAPEKGLDLLVRASAAVRERGWAHRTVIYGEGSARSDLETLIASLGAEDLVTLAGHVPDPIPLISEADLFCLPSLREGFPVSLLEAMAVGLPVIASDLPGCVLALDDGKYGEIVPRNSVDALTDALERHLKDPSTLQRRAQTAPTRAREWDVRPTALRALVYLRRLTQGLPVTDQTVIGSRVLETQRATAPIDTGP